MNALSSLMPLIGQLVSSLLPPLADIIAALLPVASQIVSMIGKSSASSPPRSSR